MTDCDTCQRTKWPNKNVEKLPAKEAGKIPLNKLFVDLMDPYILRIKLKKEILNLKSVTIIYIM